MIGGNIRRLRIERGLTQKNLADKLFVSAQAVSRWENNEVEPSVNTIIELAKIFEVSTDEIFGVDTNDRNEHENTDSNAQGNEQINNEKSYTFKEKVTFSICMRCNKPIYNDEDMVCYGSTQEVFCRNCDKIRAAEMAEREAKRKEQEKARAEAVAAEKIRQEKKIWRKTKRRRIFSFIFSPMIASIWILSGFSDQEVFFTDSNFWIGSLVLTITTFTYVSCCFLGNTFVAQIVPEMMMWSIDLPGVLFEFSFDGCLFFIGMKLLFWLLSWLLVALLAVLGFIIGLIVSPFVYPYALVKSYREPII